MTRPRLPRGAGRADVGAVAVELALAIAVLVLPVVLLVAGLGPWLQRRAAAVAIAGQTARHVVLGTLGPIDPVAARAFADATGRNLGLASGDLAVEICPSDAPCPDGVARDAVITVRVAVRVPILRVPLWGIEAGGWWWTVDHAEVVDRYRGAT